eukprot:Clim_evm16s229 gene=Clim_evmTU16s229
MVSEHTSPVGEPVEYRACRQWRDIIGISCRNVQIPQSVSTKGVTHIYCEVWKDSRDPNRSLSEGDLYSSSKDAEIVYRSEPLTSTENPSWLPFPAALTQQAPPLTRLSASSTRGGGIPRDSSLSTVRRNLAWPSDADEVIIKFAVTNDFEAAQTASSLHRFRMGNSRANALPFKVDNSVLIMELTLQLDALCVLGSDLAKFNPFLKPNCILLRTNNRTPVGGILDYGTAERNMADDASVTYLCPPTMLRKGKCLCGMDEMVMDGSDLLSLVQSPQPLLSGGLVPMTAMTEDDAESSLGEWSQPNTPLGPRNENEPPQFPSPQEGGAPPTNGHSRDVPPAMGEDRTVGAYEEFGLRNTTSADSAESKAHQRQILHQKQLGDDLFVTDLPSHPTVNLRQPSPIPDSHGSAQERRHNRGRAATMTSESAGYTSAAVQDLEAQRQQRAAELEAAKIPAAGPRELKTLLQLQAVYDASRDYTESVEHAIEGMSLSVAAQHRGATDRGLLQNAITRLQVACEQRRLHIACMKLLLEERSKDIQHRRELLHYRKTTLQRIGREIATYAKRGDAQTTRLREVSTLRNARRNEMLGILTGILPVLGTGNNGVTDMSGGVLNASGDVVDHSTFTVAGLPISLEMSEGDKQEVIAGLAALHLLVSKTFGILSIPPRYPLVHIASIVDDGDPSGRPNDGDDGEEGSRSKTGHEVGPAGDLVTSDGSPVFPLNRTMSSNRETYQRALKYLSRDIGQLYETIFDKDVPTSSMLSKMLRVYQVEALMTQGNAASDLRVLLEMEPDSIDLAYFADKADEKPEQKNPEVIE